MVQRAPRINLAWPVNAALGVIEDLLEIRDPARHSADGKTWIQLESDDVWAKRHAQASYVFEDKIWVLGGHARQG